MFLLVFFSSSTMKQCACALCFEENGVRVKTMQMNADGSRNELMIAEIIITNTHTLTQHPKE